MIPAGVCPCGAPVPLKRPGTPGRQSTYCGQACAFRFRKRAQRTRQRPSALADVPDDVLVRTPQAILAAYGVEL